MKLFASTFAVAFESWPSGMASKGELCSMDGAEEIHSTLDEPVLALKVSGRCIEDHAIERHA